MEWIEAVLNVVRQTPQWIYIFLTKNCKRYLEFNFASNCWLGATCDTQKRYNEAVEVFSKMKNKPAVSFISFEPLLEEIECGNGLKHFQWIIIGAQSQTLEVNEIQPSWNAVEKLLFSARKHNAAVYFKPNLKVRPREYPEVEKRAQLRQKALFE